VHPNVLVLLQTRVRVRMRVLMRVVDEHVLMPVPECQMPVHVLAHMRTSTRASTRASG
jgi:hypothetical protein